MFADRIPRLIRVVPALLLVAAFVPARVELFAEVIPHRSIRQPQPHPKDDRDWPRYTRRKSQLGWEYWSRHFCVTSTTSAEEAEWVAKDLEETWTHIGRLADFWTDAHHQPTFCISAVGVMVTRRWQNANGPQPGGPRTLNDDVALFVDIAPGQPDLATQMPQVRREAVHSFIRVTQLDQILPDWVQTGLAEFVAEQQAGERPGRSLAVPTVEQARMKVQEFRRDAGDGEAEQAEPTSKQPGSGSETLKAVTGQATLAATSAVRDTGRGLPNLDTTLPVFLARPPQRTTPDTVPPVPTDPVASSAWVRFLLTGYDASYSPLLLRALGETVAARGEDRLRWAAVSQGVWRPPIDPRLFRESWQPADLLVSRRAATVGELGEQWNQWRRDPLVGQPILEAGGVTDPAVLTTAGEMIVLLKLAARFPSAPAAARPKVFTFDPQAENDSSKQGAKPDIAPIDLAGLHARLTSDTTPPWATLEADGQLLFWTDRERVAALFDGAEWHDRSFVRDGHQVLERTVSGGRRLAVWLEENPDQPQRPLARLTVTP
ncbi:MAG: hypothetical protein KF708_22340 [Pirellulales bacterium]|nr:hypothetical protein [Pirellulales bacterium]